MGVDDGRTIPSERMRDKRVVTIGQGLDLLSVEDVGVDDRRQIFQRLEPSTDGPLAESAEGHLFSVIIQREEGFLLVLLTKEETQEVLNGFSEGGFGLRLVSRGRSILLALVGRARPGLSHVDIVVVPLGFVIGFRLITLLHIRIYRPYSSALVTALADHLQLTFPSLDIPRPIRPLQPGLILEFLLKLTLSVIN